MPQIEERSMSFLVRLKHGIGKLLPAKKVENNRTKKGRGLRDNVRLAIVFQNKDEAHFKKKRNFLQHLKGEYGVREGLILVYFDQLEKDRPLYLNQLKELQYFTKEDLNWRLRPAKILTGFCKKEFDILLDLTTEPCDALEHVVAGSIASMKVGRKGSIHEKYMDLIMDIPENLGEDDFLKYTEYYLSKLSFN